MKILLAVLMMATVSSAPVLSQTSEADRIDLRPGSYSFGLFGMGGFAINDKFNETLMSDSLSRRLSAPLTLHEFSAGLGAGKVLTAPHGSRLLRGQLEMRGELTPLWIAHYPRQKLVYPQAGTTGELSAETRYGISVTPLLVRWDFASSRRFVPWAQLGGGLLWTNHKFPQFPVRTADTSVFNFTPQFGVGTNVFVRPRQSLFIALNAVHISNASLGDGNPGVNVSAQFSVGYSWWK